MADLTEEEAYAKALRDAATASTETIKQAQVDEYFKNKPVKEKGESNASYNERITQWYKDQPHPDLTPEQAAAGATLQWKRTGKAGAGKYVVSYPIGVQFDKTTGKPIIDPETGEVVNVFNPKKTDANLNTGGKTEDKRIVNSDGSITVFYTDGTSSIIPKSSPDSANLTFGNTTSTTTTDAAKIARQSAYDLLYQQFKQYGLESLVEGIKGLIQKDVSPSQFTIELRNTPAYKARFAANDQRIKAGYKALDEATYLGLEDAYQKLMMNYGLPNSYWEKGEMGVQPGFEKLIAGNVDPIELENRLQLAVDQIEKGPKEYMDAIKQFYPDVTRSDLMAYVLDPANALKAIQSKVKAAQVGGEYLRSGLATNVARAEELARQGVTADMARANIPTIMEAAKRGGELAGFYQAAGLGPYDQATAEEEIYNMGKAAEARKKRQQLTSLEQSAFSGSYGGAQGALARDRAGGY